MSRSTNLQNQSSEEMIEVPEELEYENDDIIWSGGASVCCKNLKHYPAFTRSGSTIPVYSFVFIMAREDTHNIGYLEDLYEDLRSRKMVKVRWFHRTEEVSGLISNPRPNEIVSTPHVQAVSAECVDGLATVLTPKHYEICMAIVSEGFTDGIYRCSRQIKKNRVTPFPLSNLRGYTNQTIFSVLDPSIGPDKLKQLSSRQEKQEAVASQGTKEIQRPPRVLKITNSVSDNQVEENQPTSSKGLDGTYESHHEVPPFSVGKITNPVFDNQVEKTQPKSKNKLSSKGLDGTSAPHNEVPPFSVGKITNLASDNQVEKTKPTSSKGLDGTSRPHHEFRIPSFSVGKVTKLVSNNQVEKTKPTSSKGFDGTSEPHHEFRIPSFNVGKVTKLVSDNQVEKTKPTSSKGLDGTPRPHHEFRIPSFSVGKVTNLVSDNQVKKTKPTSSKGLDGTSEPHHEFHIPSFSVGKVTKLVSDNQVEKTKPTSSKGLDGTSEPHHEFRIPSFSVGKATNLVSDNQVKKTLPSGLKSRIKLSSKGLDGISKPHHQVPSFSVGEEIEVLSNDSGIRGCWFRCKILKVLEKRLKVLYLDVEDADSLENLVEWINAYRVAVPDKLGMRCLGRPTVRPFPAKDSSNGSFSIGAPVDAWWFDGWWEGVIVATNIRWKNPFRVYFPGENRFQNFENEKLRTSKDWIVNKWVELNPKPDVLNIIPPDVKSNINIQRCLALGGSSGTGNGNGNENGNGNGSSSVDHKFVASTETEAAEKKEKDLPVLKRLRRTWT